MLRLPLETESTKRSCASRGKVCRSIAHCGLRMRVPWQVAQLRANRVPPFWICSAGNWWSCAPASMPRRAAALAPRSARPRFALASSLMSRCLVRQHCEGPHRSAGGDAVGGLDRPVDDAADARQDGDILAALVRVGDRRRVDAGSGLELPQGLSGVLVEGNELAVE